MVSFSIILIITALLCSLVAGFLFAFAVVVMPGLRSLKDAEFIRAFQVMDEVIQKNQPLFILVWVGSVIAFIAGVFLAYIEGDNSRFVYLAVVLAVYLLGVQLPTGIINVPLNNRLQTLDVDAMSASELENSRNDFEARWNRSNVFRTFVSIIVSASLLLLLFRL